MIKKFTIYFVSFVLIISYHKLYPQTTSISGVSYSLSTSVGILQSNTASGTLIKTETNESKSLNKTNVLTISSSNFNAPEYKSENSPIEFIHLKDIPEDIKFVIVRLSIGDKDVSIQPTTITRSNFSKDIRIINPEGITASELIISYYNESNQKVFTRKFSLANPKIKGKSDNSIIDNDSTVNLKQIRYEYNFEKNEFVLITQKAKKSYNIGDRVLIKVEGIKPYLYQTSIQSSYIDFYSENNKAISLNLSYNNKQSLKINNDFVIPVNIYLDSPNLKGFDTTTGFLNNQIHEIENLISLIDTNDLDTFSMNLGKDTLMSKYVDYAINLLDNKDVYSFNWKTIRSSLKNKLEELKNTKSYNSKSSISYSVQKELEARMKNFNSKLYGLEWTKYFYNSLLSVLYTDNISSDSMRVLQTRLVKLFLQYSKKTELTDKAKILYELYERFHAFNTANAEISYYLDKVISVYPITAPGYVALKDIQTKLYYSKKQIDDFNYPEFFSHTLKIYDAINKANFSINYYSSIAENDEVEYKIEINPIPNLELANPLRTTSYIDKLKLASGMKMDISSGLFFSILGDDNSYFLQQDGANNVTIIKKSNPNWYLPSVGFLMHVYKRTDQWFQTAGCFGVSTNSFTKFPYIHIGGSFMFGRTQRFVISLGITGGSVKVLDSKYELSKSYQNTQISDPVPTIEAFRLGGFIGITYNLSKDLQKQFKTPSF